MPSKNSEIFNFNYSAQVLLIFLSYLGEDCDLNECLLNKLLIFFNDLECLQFFVFMIKYFDNFPEGSPAYSLQYLIAVGNMIAQLIFIELTKLQSRITRRITTPRHHCSCTPCAQSSGQIFQSLIISITICLPSILRFEESFLYY